MIHLSSRSLSLPLPSSLSWRLLLVLFCSSRLASTLLQCLTQSFASLPSSRECKKVGLRRKLRTKGEPNSNSIFIKLIIANIRSFHCTTIQLCFFIYALAIAPPCNIHLMNNIATWSMRCELFVVFFFIHACASLYMTSELIMKYMFCKTLYKGIIFFLTLKWFGCCIIFCITSSNYIDPWS